MTLYQQVRRQSKRIAIVEVSNKKTVPVPEVVPVPKVNLPSEASSDLSSITDSIRNLPNDTNDSNKNSNHQEDTPLSVGEGDDTTTTTELHEFKKTRRSSREVQRLNAQ
jgi:hypothetical protein